MGILGIFGAIAIVFCVIGIIFADCRETKVGCAIATAILIPIVAIGFFLEVYGGNHPITTVKTYRAFSIDTYSGNIEFEEAQMVEETNVKYGYASVFHNNSIVYKVTPLRFFDEISLE